MLAEYLRRVILDGSTLQENGCWDWDGQQAARGYGRIWIFGARVPAHIFSYCVFIGQPEPNRHLHHRCERPVCVNPLHLEPLTARDHALLHRRLVRR